MKIYFAPMEGITTSPFRNAHAAIFKGVNKYYAPFINVTEAKGLSRSEKYDLSDGGNPEFEISEGRLVPQLMGKNPEFLSRGEPEFRLPVPDRDQSRQRSRYTT